MSMSAPSSNSSSPSVIPPPPSRLPPPTGNLWHDSIQSAKHVTDIPCARNSLLAGIASGAGIGVVRGISAGPMVAGNWAIATFAIVSLGTFHLCQKQFADERRRVTKVIESMPRRTLKHDEADETSSSSPSAKST